MTSHHQKLEHQHESPDAWHRHTSGEGHSQHEHGAHANPKVLLVTLIAMVFGTLFVVLVLMAFFNTYTSRFKTAMEESTSIGQPAREARAAATGALSSWGWTPANTLRMPIDQAMEAVVLERSEQG